jgi:hypothetical protein
VIAGIERQAGWVLSWGGLIIAFAFIAFVAIAI